MNSQRLELRLLGYINLLRRGGYAIGVQETMDALRALQLPLFPEQQYTRHVLRALTCRDHDQWRRFDDLFRQYWFPQAQGDPANSSNLPAPPRRHHSGGIAGIGGSSHAHEEAVRDLSGILGAGAGRQRTITRADFRFLQDRQAAQEAERLAERLAEQWRKRLRRRVQVSRHGKKLDMRKTLRGNLRFGGLPLNPFRLRRRREPPHLIMLHDVSHSMAWNNPLLFRFARGLVRTFPSCEAFAFHTRLFHVTPLYRERSLDTMKQRLETHNHLWLGGTCIADSIRYFVRHFGRTLLKPGTTIIIMSDGFDTNDPALLGAALEDLKSRARRIVWLNPMLGREDYRPDEDFMRLVAPLIDLLAPAHSVGALEDAIRRMAA